MNEEKSKYQLYYYWNHGMCDQCGAPILILNEALSYEGNDQQELQAFLAEHTECRYFSNKDEQKIFEENGGCKKLEETYNYRSPYWAMRFVGSKSLLGQFCCSACKEKWIREREADHLKIYTYFCELREYALKVDPEPCDNPSGIVVFDLETTGLNSNDNEILQISAVDGNGDLLLNEYVRPGLIRSWPDAELVNGITPERVRKCKTIRELIGKIKGVFASGKTWIAYNCDFDLGFLFFVGIEPSTNTELEDVMYDFAEICGNYDKRYGTRRWQTLEAAAAHFGYNYKAHDSLEDARATLYIRNRIKREKEILDELTAPYQTVKGEQI